jgi:hypothetical protein
MTGAGPQPQVAPGDGDRQRHPRLLLRRWPLRRRPRAAVAHGRTAARPGRRPPRHRRRVHPPRRHPPGRERRARPRRARSSASSPAPALSSPSTPCAPRWLRPPSSPAPRIVNDVSGGLADPRHPRRRRRQRRPPTSRCTGAPTPTGCATSPTTPRTASWRPCAGSSPSGSHRAESAGIPRERIVLDPGLGFAKQPAPQLGAAAPRSTSARRARLPAARRARAASPSWARCSRTTPCPRPVDAAGARPRRPRRAPGLARGRLPARARRTSHPRRARRRRCPRWRTPS